MRLSSDDLPMFFDTPHQALAERLRGAVRDLEAAEGLADEPARDRAAVQALAAHGLFELVAPASG